MNDRDELESVLVNVLSNAMNYPDPVVMLGKDTGPLREKVADAVLAAGYRKLRTITTVEELEALPEDSIIREGESVVATRIGNSWWYPTGPFEPNLPVTVLHNPEEAS